MNVDRTGWSGEGQFTHVLLEHLSRLDAIAALRVEDAPASRSEADYNFISNEIFVVFARVIQEEQVRRLGVFPARKKTSVKALSVPQLEPLLATAAEIGLADYSDEGMLQYLRTERIIPPYQTRGYKLVELVRIYDAEPPKTI